MMRSIRDRLARQYRRNAGQETDDLQRVCRKYGLDRTAAEKPALEVAETPAEYHVTPSRHPKKEKSRH
jgi:hypothetical protein